MQHRILRLGLVLSVVLAAGVPGASAAAATPRGELTQNQARRTLNRYLAGHWRQRVTGWERRSGFRFIYKTVMPVYAEVPETGAEWIYAEPHYAYGVERVRNGAIHVAVLGL